MGGAEASIKYINVCLFYVSPKLLDTRIRHPLRLQYYEFLIWHLWFIGAEWLW